MLDIMKKVHYSSPVLFRIVQSESCLLCVVSYEVLFCIKFNVYETVCFTTLISLIIHFCVRLFIFPFRIWTYPGVYFVTIFHIRAGTFPLCIHYRLVVAVSHPVSTDIAAHMVLSMADLTQIAFLSLLCPAVRHYSAYSTTLPHIYPMPTPLRQSLISVVIISTDPAVNHCN